MDNRDFFVITKYVYIYIYIYIFTYIYIYIFIYILYIFHIYIYIYMVKYIHIYVIFLMDDKLIVNIKSIVSYLPKNWLILKEISTRQSQQLCWFGACGGTM